MNKRIWITLAAVVLVIVAAILLTDASGGDDPQGLPVPTKPGAYQPLNEAVFPESPDWSTPIPDDATTDPMSATWVAYLLKRYEQRSSAAPFLTIRRYSVPVWVGKASDPVRTLSPCSDYPCPQLAGSKLRVPDAARPDPGSDGHMVLVDQENGIAYDLFKAVKTANGWQGKGGAKVNYRGQDAGTGPVEGATAAHLALLAGLVRPEEIKRGRINHALQFTVPGIGKGAPRCPANFNVSTVDDPDAPREGTKFQLSKDIDVNKLNLPKTTRIVGVALQRYGMIINDNGGQLAFRGESSYGKKPDLWAKLGYRDEESISLAGLPLDKLRVISQPDC
ncbi:MAG: hypothetical protein JHC87_06885 [Thermoleophilaceae bacterium]|nr:hypothetical protein [Thermoleophilaceae bacterium]